jgi:ribonuclease P protein component
MKDSGAQTLRKEERLSSRKGMEDLFTGGCPSVSSFPIRVVYKTTPTDGVRILISVSKRHFKRAVKRNRIKRQIREAYRQNKSLLQVPNGGVDMAFLWTSDDMLPTDTVFHKIQHLLTRINENIGGKASFQG